MLDFTTRRDAQQIAGDGRVDWDWGEHRFPNNEAVIVALGDYLWQHRRDAEPIRLARLAAENLDVSEESAHFEALLIDFIRDELGQDPDEYSLPEFTIFG